jgi:hypothetical protein
MIALSALLRGLYRYARLQILRERRRQRDMSFEDWLQERAW